MNQLTSWRSLPLVDLVQDRQISYGIVQPGHDAHGGVPIVRVKDLQGGILDTRCPLRVDPAIARKHSRTTLQGGELLLSLVGTVGLAAVAPEEVSGWNVARAIAVIRPKYVTAQWLRICLASPSISSELRRVLNTTVQATLNLSDLKRIEIPVPPPSIRDSITEVLGALDAKITANVRLASAVDDFLAILLASLLTATPGEETALRKIADVNAESLSPTLGGSLRYLDIAAVGVGRFDLPEIVDWEGAPSRARRRVRKGDTLWSTVRPNRRSHALNLSDDPLLVGSTGLAVLSPRETGFAYLYEVTKLPEFTTYLESAAEGSAYPAVRADRFGDVPVPLLPASAREHFESIAAPMREHAFSLNEQNRTLATTRDALLPQLMSGKIRVTDAEKSAGEML